MWPQRNTANLGFGAAPNSQPQMPPMNAGGFSPVPMGMQSPPPGSVPMMAMPPPMNPNAPLAGPQQAEGQRRQMALERLRQLMMMAQQGGRGPMGTTMNPGMMNPMMGG